MPADDQTTPAVLPSDGAAAEPGRPAALDEADRRVAVAAAAARASAVRQASEHRARRLREAARDRIRAREGAASRADAAISATAAGVGMGASGRRHDARTPARDVRLRLRTLVLTGLAVALVAGLVGGVVGGAVTWLFASQADARGGPSSPTGAVVGERWLSAAVERASVSVVSLRVSSGTRSEIGSGVVLTAEGHVLTNAHVVTLDGTVDDAEVVVTAADGRLYDATLVGLDPLADLAVIQLSDAEGLVPASFGDSEAIAVGQPTIVLGAPLGLSETVTSGVVSNRLRSIEIVSSQVPDETDTNLDPDSGARPSPPPGGSTIHLGVFQTDAAINPGNSGGPVVDAGGEVIGIAVAIATTTGHGASTSAAGSIGLGFAIPGNVALRIAQDLIEGRAPGHGAFGVSVMSSTNAAAPSGAAVLGAYVDSLTEAGAADRAGIEAGDVITAVAGNPVRGPGDLLAFARLFEAGDEIEVVLQRAGEERTVRVTLDSAA